MALATRLTPHTNYPIIQLSIEAEYYCDAYNTI